MYPKEIALQVVGLVVCSLVAAFVELQILEDPPEFVFLRENASVGVMENPGSASSATSATASAVASSVASLQTVDEFCVDGKCDMDGLSVVVYISVETAGKLYEANESQFIDARGEEEFLAGHVPYAMQIPVNAFATGWPDELDLLMKELTTVVYCNGQGCDSSQLVAKHLVRFGFKDVKIVERGFPGWLEEGLPEERGAGDV